MPFVTPYASEHQLTKTLKMLTRFLLGSKKKVREGSNFNIKLSCSYIFGAFSYPTQKLNST